MNQARCTLNFRQLFGGLLIGWYGYEAVFSLAGVMYLVAGVLYGTMFRAEGRRLREAGA